MQTQTDKATSHNYSRWYAKVFEKVQPESLLEVGVKEGRSIAAWKMLFPFCNITGADITDKNFIDSYIQMADARIVLQDSTDSKFTKTLNDTYDVIIDDGSHFYKDIIKTFYNLKDSFKHAYIIEDAMYKQDFVIKCIRRMGFKVVEEYPSNVKNVPVDLTWLRTNSYSKNKEERKLFKVNLSMIVVYKD